MQTFKTMLAGVAGSVITLFLYILVAPAQAAYTPVPTGLIAHFNSSTCPTGWTVVANLRGAGIVGLPAGGTLATLVGTALTNLENRATGIHNHTASSTAPTINDSGHTHNLEARSTGGTNRGVNRVDGLLAGLFTFFWDNTNQGFTSTNTTGITTNAPTITVNNSSGVAGTNAPYVHYLPCSKN